MRPTDLLILPLAALRQQKLRTILTLLGVVFGAFVLTASLSIGEGVQQTIDRESRKYDISRRVTVFAKWDAVGSKAEPAVTVDGTMSPERRERLRKILADQARNANALRALVEVSGDRLKKLAELPHVESVTPIVNDSGVAFLGSKFEGTGIFSGPTSDENFVKRIIVGRGFDAPDQKAALVSEFLAYKMGLTNESDLQQLIGRPIRLEIQGQKAAPRFNVSISGKVPVDNKDQGRALEQLAAQLPGTLDKFDLDAAESEALRSAVPPEDATSPTIATEEFPVVGVFRTSTPEEQKESWSPFQTQSGVVLPYRTAADFHAREPGRREQGVGQAVLLVDKEANVKEVVKQVEALGLGSRAAIEFIERERLTYTLIFGGMTCVAGVALLVSSLGIANTMLMSVLERRREIGIMKAVGADNRHLLFGFVVEAALIGLAGASLGLLLAWSASFPGDAWVRSMVNRDMKIDLKGSIFAFPPWIGGTVIISTVLVTTLAAFYPARHAARIDPVKALRHE